MRFLIVFFLYSLWTCTPVSAYYEFDKNLEKAYAAVIRLRLEEGAALLKKEHIEKPGNNLTLLFENYIDFLKAFISEEEERFVVLKKKTSERIRQLNRDKDGPSSPFHLYATSEMILQEAMLKVKFREHVSAATDIRKAYKLIQKNKAIFPTFPLNEKLSGFMHTLVGAVPREYHWLVELAGMEGTVSGGTAEIVRLYNELEGGEYACFREELLFYLSNIHNSFAKNEMHGEQLLDWMQPFTMVSPLIRYCYANVSMKMGRNEDALRVLQFSSESTGVFPFYFLRYKIGLARLRRLDLAADQDLIGFVADFKGSNYIKAAWQKIAWVSFLRGDLLKYNECMAKCRAYGTQFVDEDKEAMNEALSGELPNAILLKSRLLFDGGYYKEALAGIAGQPLDSFPRYRDQLEVTYRLGRILMRLKQTEKALEYLKQTLKNGANSHYYFAANSALLLGNYYEDQGELFQASIYYVKCLELENHEYQNSIDQKAQAGLDRIKEAKEE